MAIDFQKVTYVDGETVIGAGNLNDIQDAILDLDDNKVEKEPGKGLSTNDYSDTDKSKVDTALQAVPDTYRTAADQDTIDAAQDDRLDDLEQATTSTTIGPSPIVTFDASAADMPLKGLTVNIEPVQEGTGDPSPTNVRPISGRTGCNVLNSNKNYIKFTPGVTTHNGVTYTVSDDGSILLSGAAAGGTSVLKRALTTEERTALMAANKLYFAGGTIDENASTTYGLVLARSDGTVLKEASNSILEVTTSVIDIAQAQIIVRNGTNVNGIVLKPILAIASEATIRPISWESEAGTVYGGTLTINADGSGELAENWVKVLASETWSTGWTYAGNVYTPYFEHATNVNIEKRELSLCNKYKNGVPSSSGMADMSFGVLSSGKFIRFRNSNYTNVTDFVASLSDVEVVIPLAQDSPSIRTHHLTATEITTLLGTNNIWADCGNVTVTYGAYLETVKKHADVVGDSILSAIAPLEASYTASRAYAVGEFIFVGTKFYKVISAIAEGGTITPGTNAVQTTVAEQLIALAAG